MVGAGFRALIPTAQRQCRGAVPGTGSSATRTCSFPLLRAVVLAARALPGSGTVTLSAGWSPRWDGEMQRGHGSTHLTHAGLRAGCLFTAIQPKSWLKSPARQWGTKGWDMGLAGMTLQGCFTPWRG